MSLESRGAAPGDADWHAASYPKHAKKKQVSFDPALCCPHIEGDLESVTTQAPDELSPSLSSSQASPTQECQMVVLDDAGPSSLDGPSRGSPRQAEEAPGRPVPAAAEAEPMEALLPVRTFSHRRTRSNSGG